MTAATLAAIAIAASTWGHPCGGNVDVKWGGVPSPYVAESIIDNNRCMVRFNRHGAKRLRNKDWPMYCTVMVHEFGHLAGQGHSTDPDSVMYPEINKVYGGCK